MFWAASSYEPSRKNRFRFVYTEMEAGDGGGGNIVSKYWWWTTAITLPSFEINDETYQLVNRKFRYPGLLTWNDVQVTLIEDGKRASDIMRILQKAGYSCGAVGETCIDTGILKGGFYNKAKLLIEEIDPSGKALQTFDLQNWFLKGANFGELSMDSDDLLTIQLTIGYDCAFIATTKE